jgi:glutamine amidotransferase
VLFEGVTSERFYFVHSYAALPTGDRTDGETEAVHGQPFVAAVERDGLAATQFHPEKSGAAGLRLLRNWVASLS